MRRISGLVIAQRVFVEIDVDWKDCGCDVETCLSVYCSLL